jgi:hypothetical protein
MGLSKILGHAVSSTSSTELPFRGTLWNGVAHMGWLLDLYYTGNGFAALKSESHHFISMVHRFSCGVDWKIGLQL